jgi:hypothetical protein
MINESEPTDWKDLQVQVARILSECGMATEIEKDIRTARDRQRRCVGSGHRARALCHLRMRMLALGRRCPKGGHPQLPHRRHGLRCELRSDHLLQRLPKRSDAGSPVYERPPPELARIREHLRATLDPSTPDADAGERRLPWLSTSSRSIHASFERRTGSQRTDESDSRNYASSR